VSLLVIIPSRGRPERLREAVDSGLHLIESDVRYIIAIDDDDPKYSEYQSWFPEDEYVWTCHGQRRTLTEWTNHIAGLVGERFDYLASFGDDHVPLTPGWDKLLTEAIRDMGGTGFSYPNDMRRVDIPEAVVMSSDIPRALGWMALPSLRHFYIDNVWADLGRGINRLTYVPFAVVEHRHYSVHRATERDATYVEAEARGAEDFAAYRAWQANGRDADIAKLRELL
jgi:hypothetical protein